MSECRFLVFRLYGPMASWGEVAVGEVRPTDSRPTRSALLGLLGAALGVRRDDPEAQDALSGPLRFALLTESSGRPLRDYHTIQLSLPKGKERHRSRPDQLHRRQRDELSTIVSRRDYLTDAVYRVAVWQEGEPGRWSLEELAQALEQPVFPLYLGRKACPPALPLAPRVITATTLPEALGEYGEPPGWTHLGMLGEGTRPLAWEGDPPLGSLQAKRRVRRRDQPASRKQWLFESRHELLGSLPAPTEDRD